MQIGHKSEANDVFLIAFSLKRLIWTWFCVIWPSKWKVAPCCLGLGVNSVITHLRRYVNVRSKNANIKDISAKEWLICVVMK